MKGFRVNKMYLTFLKKKCFSILSLFEIDMDNFAMAGENPFTNCLFLPLVPLGIQCEFSCKHS